MVETMTQEERAALVAQAARYPDAMAEVEEFSSQIDAINAEWEAEKVAYRERLKGAQEAKRRALADATTYQGARNRLLDAFVPLELRHAAERAGAKVRALANQVKASEEDLRTAQRALDRIDPAAMGAGESHARQHQVVVTHEARVAKWQGELATAKAALEAADKALADATAAALAE